MAITITKLGNQAKIAVTGQEEKKYFDVQTISNSFSIDSTTLIVASTLLDNWATPAPLADFTIAGNTGMTSVADLSAALADLTVLATV